MQIFSENSTDLNDVDGSYQEALNMFLIEYIEVKSGMNSMEKAYPRQDMVLQFLSL